MSASSGPSPPHLVWLLGCLRALLATGGRTPPPTHPIHPVLLTGKCLLRTPRHSRVAQGVSLSPAAALDAASPPPPPGGDGVSLGKGEHPGTPSPAPGAGYWQWGGGHTLTTSPLPPWDTVAVLLATSWADSGQPRRDRSSHPPLPRNGTGPGAAAALAREMPPSETQPVI